MLSINLLPLLILSTVCLINIQYAYSAQLLRGSGDNNIIHEKNSDNDEQQSSPIPIPQGSKVCLTASQCEIKFNSIKNQIIQHENESSSIHGKHRFYVGDFATTKGCFTKSTTNGNSNVYFGTGGSEAQMSESKLPGTQTRVWCDIDIAPLPSSSTLKQPTDAPVTTLKPSTMNPTNKPTATAVVTTVTPEDSSPVDETETETLTKPKIFTTTFNGDKPYAGNMFDILAPNNHIAISSMAIHTFVAHPITVQVYTKVGTYQGYENYISSWTYVGSVSITAGGADGTAAGGHQGQPTWITGAFDQDKPIIVQKGTRRAFYITANGSYLHSTSAGTNNLNEGDEVVTFNDNDNDNTNPNDNADIKFYVGVGKGYPITSGTKPDRIWNGQIRYTILKNNTFFLPSTEVSFERGDLSNKEPVLGINMCRGMSVRVLARAGQNVRLINNGGGGETSSSSLIPFHSMPDGAAVIPIDDDGGYAYVSNSEMKQKLGGVYGMYFDRYGNVNDYKQLLSGTTRNCSGGKTSWGSWLSCEEYGNGQCWQVDPKGERQPQITKLGGTGGNYESVAVDHRRKRQPIFYVTEDKEYGALRRYIPRYSNADVNWDTLHEDGGETTFLVFNEDGSTFDWTTNEQAARNSQAKHYPNVEGIDFDDTNGLLYFVSKKRSTLYVLDLLAKTYTTSLTKTGALEWGGWFNHSPDQIVSHKGGEYLYMTEDGGKTVGVYAIHKPTGKRYTMFEAYTDQYHHDETTGLAFSPDGTKMYAVFQDCGCDQEDSENGISYNCGCLLEFSRQDGRSFEGATMGLKFHST